MSTLTRRRKRKELRASGKLERVPKGGAARSRIAYYAWANCGCCKVGPMHFDSEVSFMKVLSKTRFTSFGTITDDEGVTHENIDTFYGFWRDDPDQAE
jgi:hypothetical protein